MICNIVNFEYTAVDEISLSYVFIKIMSVKI